MQYNNTSLSTNTLETVQKAQLIEIFKLSNNAAGIAVESSGTRGARANGRERMVFSRYAFLEGKPNIQPRCSAKCIRHILYKLKEKGVQ